MGFFVSGVAASMLRAFAPFGLLTALLRWNAFPLYPEQDQYRAATTPEQYARWKASVPRTCG